MPRKKSQAEPEIESPKKTRERVKSFSKVAHLWRERGFRPAREVFTPIQAVPTCFVQLDHATRVGGFPIERVCVCHGRSNEGKTALLIGLAGSFIVRGHYAADLDAERTMTIPWVRNLLGSAADDEKFFGERPDTYEDAIAMVRRYANTLIEMRGSKEISADTCGFVGVDSMKKLVPAKFLKEVLDADAKSGDVAVQSRLAQHQAAINSLWLHELVPLAEKARLGVLLVAREMDDPDADPFQKRVGNDFKVGGGRALIYDSSLVFRVERASYVTHGEGKDRKVYGERHRVTIRKTKIAGKNDKVVTFYFHTSNGVLIPEGFDRARDVLELALRFGVVKKGGSSYAHAGHRIGVGEHAVVKLLTERPEHLVEIEKEVRSKFAEVAPQEHDEATGEVST